jgi:FkbM family methyltransferase
MIPSFSQFGEDRVIDAYFKEKKDGFYVDIGCNQPIAYSNTWKLYLKGWKGIAIDANPSLISEYKKIRPRDAAIATVVSNNNEVLEFYFSKTSHLISGIGEKTEGNWKRTKENSDIVRYKADKLCDILQEYSVSFRFDLLSIDVEGNELNVLESLQIEKFRPSLIVVEMHHFDILIPNQDAVYNKLSKNGYKLIGYFPPTGFFALIENHG